MTFVARRDTIYGVSAALAWQPTANVAVAASLSYESQASRFFLADFEALEGTAGLSFRLRFRAFPWSGGTDGAARSFFLA